MPEEVRREVPLKTGRNFQVFSQGSVITLWFRTSPFRLCAAFSKEWTSKVSGRKRTGCAVLDEAILVTSDSDFEDISGVVYLKKPVPA